MPSRIVALSRRRVKAKRRSGEGKLSVGGTLEHIRADPVSIQWTSKPKQPVHVIPPGGAESNRYSSTCPSSVWGCSGGEGAEGAV